MMNSTTSNGLQGFTSAKTSMNRNKLPKLFSKVDWERFRGCKVLDIGCGAFISHIQEYLKAFDIQYFGYDKFNQPSYMNDRALLETPDVVVSSNLLNVIDSDEVVASICNFIESYNVPYFVTVYVGDSKNVGRPTSSDSYQRNSPLREYLRFFKTGIVYRGMICRYSPDLNPSKKKGSKVAIFTMGLPGAGKSTALPKIVDISGFTVIDPDKIKETHPSYDPKNPEPLHNWSKEEAEKLESFAIAQSHNIIVDGTGTNTEKMLKQLSKYRNLGYFVKLVYVKVSLETSLYRNSKRSRTVPESIVYEKYGLIEYSWDILRNYAHESILINND